MKKSSTIPWSETSALLLMWLLFVGAGTLFPFNFGVVARGHAKFFGYGFGGLEDVPDVLSNLLLFMPLDVLLHREGQRRSWGSIFALAVACAVGLLISLTVEYLHFLPTRDSSSLVDVLTNSSGALIGVCCD